VFIPHFHNALLHDHTTEIIKTLRDEVATLRQNLGSVVVGLKPPGGAYNESTGLVFSGRVFVYSTNQLKPVEIGELVKWYGEKGMHLEIRGTDYWLFNQKNEKAKPSMIFQKAILCDLRRQRRIRDRRIDLRPAAMILFRSSLYAPPLHALACQSGHPFSACNAHAGRTVSSYIE